MNPQRIGSAPSSAAIRATQTPCPAACRWISSPPSLVSASTVIDSIGWGPKTATLGWALTGRIVGQGGETDRRRAGPRMADSPIAPRLAALPVRSVAGIEVRVAVGVRARLLGLALLDRPQAGSGLLIPRCAAVHTFGMRFALDLVFLDARRRALS